MMTNQRLVGCPKHQIIFITHLESFWYIVSHMTYISSWFQRCRPLKEGNTLVIVTVGPVQNARCAFFVERAANPLSDGSLRTSNLADIQVIHIEVC